MISMTPAPEAPESTERSGETPAMVDLTVSAAVRYIQQNVERPLQVPDVAEAVGVTRRTLERRFRERLDRTVYEVITRAHINRAQQLLSVTDAPIGRIARASGFASVERMAKVFRRVEGTTPTDFRRRSKQAEEVAA